MSAQDEIDRLNRRAWELRHTRHDDATRLCREAASLATEGPFATAPYVDGLAAAEATEAFLALEAGAFADATHHGERALALLAGRPPSETLADVTVTLTWVALHTGSYADALRHGSQALETAQAGGLPYWEASAHDALGWLYAEGHDHDEALARFGSALEIARRHGFADREAAALEHLAGTYAETGDHARALDTGLAGLELARRGEVAHGRVAALSRVATALAELGRAAEARPFLDEALALDYPVQRSVRWLSLLEAMGFVHLALGELGAADARLGEALALADELGVVPACVVCHRLLADVRERQGRLREALEELRRADAISRALASENVASRLAFLRVAHQVENARRDAEIHRLRAAALQKEMEKERRTVSRLELLARSDGLTGLHNRRHMLELAVHEIERSLRYRRPLSVLLLDLDRFKGVNDQHGHAVGDQVLAGAAALLRSVAREGDAVARYGGEEFMLLLPETPLTGAVEAAERIRRAVEATAVATNVGPFAITTSIGAAELDDALRARPPAEILSALLDRADQALYRAKRGGRNSVEAFRA